jgi:hypothetical protein
MSKRAFVIPLAVSLLLGAVYAATLLRGPGHSGDTAEFQLAGRVLGTSHPPGNPGYLILNHVFTRAFPLGSVASRANLLSALFAIGAVLFLYASLRRLDVRRRWAGAAAFTFGLTPTWWRYSVVAEVYTLHVLFIAAVFWALLCWHQTRRDRYFYLGCGLYAFSFGNHLSMVTLLPAVAFLVWATDRRAFVDRRRIAAVGGLIVLAALQYLYPLWRSRVPSTPYLAESTPDLASLLPYVTGRQFHAAMFAAPLGDLFGKKIPAFLGLWLAECWPLLPFALLGAWAWRGRAAGGFLALAGVGTLVFALGYEIVDIEAYYLPVYWLTAVCAGVGLTRAERLFRERSPETQKRWAPLHPGWALAAALPLAAAAVNWGDVQRDKRPEAARRVDAFLEAVEDGLAPPVVVIAGYHEYQYLLYYILVEKRGRDRVFPERLASVEDLRVYLSGEGPLYQRHLRRWITPGLPVYCTKALREELFHRAGLRTERVGWNLYQITLDEARDDTPPAESPGGGASQ